VFTKLLTAAAIASMATAPVLAAPTSSTSLSTVRAAATAGENESELAPAVLIGVLATVAIIGGAVVLADSDDEPNSP